MPERPRQNVRLDATWVAMLTRSIRVVVIVVTVSFSISFVAGCATSPVPAPTAYNQFESLDKQYRCEYPAGWVQTAAGGKGVLSRSAFEQGSAKIAITSDMAGSLLAGPAAPPDPNVEPPVARIHELSKEKLLSDMPAAEEQPAQPVQTIFGEGRVSEFTAPGSLGNKIHGYRATVLTRDRRLVVICQCAASDWENLKGPFMKVIASLAPGSK